MLETIKCHWNFVLSNPGAQYCTANISNMYLCSLLPDTYYVCFQVRLVPDKIIEYYNLCNKIHDGYLYVQINQAWYGLKQAGKIPHDNLVAHLKQHGYVKHKHAWVI